MMDRLPTTPTSVPPANRSSTRAARGNPSRHWRAT
jgi:hypothetical protein